MIVKIQASTATTGNKQRMLIYDKSRKYQFESEISAAVKKMLGGKLKAYYSARMNGTKIEILEEMPEQDW